MIDIQKLKIKALENGVVSNGKYYPDLATLVTDNYSILNQQLVKTFDYEVTIEFKRITLNTL